MPLPVYSTQFVASNGATSYTYVCPEGYVALVSCIDTYVGLVDAGGNFTGIGGGDQVFWSSGFDAPGDSNGRWRGKQVLTAGQSVTVTCDFEFACSVSGDLLLEA